ncbi:MAG: hypothetical protein ACOYMG_17425 [Candidatus Methylumidiphilus sp.]
MEGVCRLCGAKGDLELSHLIPKFIGRWSKKTSITGYFRDSHETQKRRQDLAKEYWLCGQCEDLFSTWENEFAAKVFFPFVDEDVHTVEYGPWLAKFCASVSWRTLTYIVSKNLTSVVDTEYVRFRDRAEERLRKFLLGTSTNLFENEQHLFPLDEVKSTTIENAPSHLNRYFLRTIAMDVIGNSKVNYIYTKLPKFIILGIIRDDTSSTMRSSRVALGSGLISPRKFVWTHGIGEYIMEKVEEIRVLSDRIPQKQQEKIEAELLSDLERAKKSKLFKAIEEDVRLFGRGAFKDPK